MFMLFDSENLSFAAGNRVLLDAGISHRLDYSGPVLCRVGNQSHLPAANHVGEFIWAVYVRISNSNSIFAVPVKVLITKLRSANTVETRQYRKASKALLVLIPLLGITYLVVIYGPHEGVGSRIFAVTRAVLLSTQVSRRQWTTSIYCIFNLLHLTYVGAGM